MSKSTIYLDACNKVFGFREMGEEFKRKLIINGRSVSTHENYLRQMAKLALHYNKSPLELEVYQLEEYLYFLVKKDTDALSSFKHLVYGLRKSYIQTLPKMKITPIAGTEKAGNGKKKTQF